ncbi:MAG: exosortase-associated EpsI family protein [Phycisphaerales bacterium]|nr:exosortase-associated EpsI family protein [Phycisphaerales bacterium]
MTAQMNQSRRIAMVAATVMLLFGAVAIGAMIRVRGIHLKKTPIYPAENRQLSNLPTETESWIRVGSDYVEPAEILEVLGTENYLTRQYTEKHPKNPDRPVMIQVHGAYYTGGIDTVPHVPERCFVGGGLQQSSSSIVLPLDIDPSGWAEDRSVPEEFGGESKKVYTTRLSNDRAYTDAPGMRVRLPRNVGPSEPISMRFSEFIGQERTIYAGYFFIANGQTKANANDVRALAFNLDDDYSYYLKIQINTNAVDSLEEFIEVSGSFISEMLGEIMRCVPDWTDVQRGDYPPDNPKRNQDPKTDS